MDLKYFIAVKIISILVSRPLKRDVRNAADIRRTFHANQGSHAAE